MLNMVFDAFGRQIAILELEFRLFGKDCYRNLLGVRSLQEFFRIEMCKISRGKGHVD